MDKKKTLHSIEATILSLRDDLDKYRAQEDVKGTYYTRGRIEALEQIGGLIKAGSLDS